MLAQSITAQGDCVVLKVERKQFTVLVGKANTLLERNREMYDMVNHELMEVCAHSTCTRTARMRDTGQRTAAAHRMTAPSRLFRTSLTLIELKSTRRLQLISCNS